MDGVDFYMLDYLGLDGNKEIFGTNKAKNNNFYFIDDCYFNILMLAVL